MARRGYGQICGVSRALEIVGERWAMLIIRDLLLGPKRFTDLRQGLPRIPTNVLSARLKELEQAAVLQRRILPRPATAVVYELTDYGRELDDILIALGRWGAKSMGAPHEDDICTVDGLMMAMRASYQGYDGGLPTSPDRVSYELRVAGAVIGVTVQDGQLGITDGPQSDPDLVIEARYGIGELLTGRISPAEAIDNGSVQLTGDPERFTDFANTFRI
jgi:DNA-binding HxlR family transcriptional regulator